MPERIRHISSNFDRALYGLKNDVLMMADLTGRIFQSAMEGLFTRDSELSEHVIEEDKEVDNLEKQVDQDGLSVLIRFQPVASDMREVISAMKISTNLERIADTIHYYRAKSEAPECWSCRARSSIAGAAIPFGFGDFS